MSAQVYPSPRQVSSRLAKREQKKVLKQSLFYIVLAVVLGIFFLFVVIPGFSRLMTLFSGAAISDPGDTIPPQIPVISAPAAATHSATLNLTGFGEPSSEVVIVLNASEFARVTVNTEGEFENSIQLIEGENVLSVYGVDRAGNESSVSREYVVNLDTEKPTIEVESPQDGQVIELRSNQLTTIKGKTEPNAKIYLNGRLVFANAEGVFSTTYQLQEGSNELKLQAEDKAGNMTEKTITVSFRL